MSEEVSKIKEAQKELEITKNLAKEYLNGWKRAKADFINYQKEMEKQKEDWIKFSNAGFVVRLLPIYESVEKVVSALDESKIGKEYFEGFENIKKQFDDFLGDIGVEKIKTIGEKFDPNFHECVSVKKVEGGEAGEILEEAQAGYVMNGEVIRAAKVVVAE